MAASKFRVALLGVVAASLISVPLSSIFVVNSNAQDLQRIDQVLERYHDQVQAQSGQELQAALLASRLAGEQLAISFKTIDSQLVEIGEPTSPISALPADADLTAAKSEAITVKFSADDQVRLRTVELADGEFIIFSSPLDDHLAFVASNQLIQAGAVFTSWVLGALAGTLIGRYQANQLNLTLLRRELESERRSQESMRTLLGDVAHELKTPLTVIRGYSEILEQSTGEGDSARPVQRISSEVVRMEKLLAELLRMAELREGEAQTARDVDLAQLVKTKAEDLQTLQRGREVNLEFEGQAKVFAPPLLLEMLLNNIFSNIRKHTEFDDEVTVTLRPEDKGLLLTIEDAGPGLPDTLLTDSTGSTFRRFNELRNTSVEGQGMGLAIIKDVAAQLGAEVTFSKSETLGGLRIELRFKNLSGKNNSVK